MVGASALPRGSTLCSWLAETAAPALCVPPGTQGDLYDENGLLVLLGLPLAQAEQKGDQRKLWECAKRLAPWKPKDRTSLRGSAGEILAPRQQLSELVEYSRKKFCCGEPYISQHHLDEDFWIDPIQLEQ